MVPSKHHFVGSVIYAWMPHSETPHQPGPKYRPVLVVGVDDESGSLCIAPGTTQKLDSVLRGQILIDKIHDGQGLQQPTKFKIDNARWVPLTPAFLMGHGQQYRFAGAIPIYKVRELYEVIREADPELRSRRITSLAS
ncbi:type II toxin-antitoxin system PemK/MazF family toxin [Vreelandella massiliensis]|uniref:type II toxin-antitoxin system PemK/MazF family toxin n=1 Tax=Vreelandella massiliensis TaxID=1816686 RepID=UPI00096AB3B2|nr:type II toxin-antitoxin system PemK/MazF family toxin [Halomonas massiliensis]